jgi:hypothetical protein
MALALREQQTARLFELRRKEEPMEVDAASVAPKAEQNEVLEQIVARLESLKQDLRPKPTAIVKPKPRNKWTPDGRPICNFCSKIGHKWKECRSRLSKEAQGKTKN